MMPVNNPSSSNSTSVVLPRTTERTGSLASTLVQTIDAVETRANTAATSAPATAHTPALPAVGAEAPIYPTRALPFGGELRNVWLSELGRTDFALDTRYPAVPAPTPLFMVPKATYALGAEKLGSLDPYPGEAGYFAVLVRVADEAHISNVAALKALVAKGQRLFKALGVTSEQLATAQATAKTWLSDAHKAIEAVWEEAVADAAVPAWAEKDFETWRDLRAELAANIRVANPDWVFKSQEKADALDLKLLDAGLDDAKLGNLKDALKASVEAVAKSYTNEFEQLYATLEGNAALDAFTAFEKSLADTLPQVAYAPASAPGGRGRNARFGMAPCADVVVRLNTKSGPLVGVIVPLDDKASLKMLGGKCDPHCEVAQDGSLAVKVDTAQETALKEFIEERGAKIVGQKIVLKPEQLELLQSLTPAWQETLQGLGCVVNEGREIVRSTRAKKALEDGMRSRLNAVSPELPVPDTRTSRNSGYSTTVFEAVVDTNDPQQIQLLTLLLTLKGGDDAESYGFRVPSDVQMQSTHVGIFADYQANSCQEETHTSDGDEEASSTPGPIERIMKRMKPNKLRDKVRTLLPGNRAKAEQEQIDSQSQRVID